MFTFNCQIVSTLTNWSFKGAPFKGSCRSEFTKKIQFNSCHCTSSFILPDTHFWCIHFFPSFDVWHDGQLFEAIKNLGMEVVIRVLWVLLRAHPLRCHTNLEIFWILPPPPSVTLNCLFYWGLYTYCYKSVNPPPYTCVNSFMHSPFTV